MTDQTFEHLVATGNIDACREALRLGANVDGETSIYTLTPLQRAAERGKYAMCKMLLEHGADLQKTSDCWPLAPLFKAIRFGYFEVVKLLLDHGAPVDSREMREGFTALHHASFYGFPRIVEELLQRGATVTDEYKYAGRNVDVMCAFMRHGHMYQKLLQPWQTEEQQQQLKHQRAILFLQRANDIYNAMNKQIPMVHVMEHIVDIPFDSKQDRTDTIRIASHLIRTATQ